MRQPSRALRRGAVFGPVMQAARMGAAILLLAQGGVIHAQAVPNLPVTREALDPVPAEPPKAQSRLTIEGGIERAPCALDDPAYAAITITLRKATFNNLGPVSADELSDSYSDHLGAERPISVLCAIRDAAATKLRAMGYVAAVQVPVQRIENGEVAFEVLYARVVSLHVTGRPGRNARLIEAYLSRLTDGQVFNRFAAERYLLLARDIPGYDVRLALKPAGSGAGNMIGEVTIRSIPLVMDFSGQNYGSASTGRIGGQLRATFHGVTGMGDRTMLSAFSTSDFTEQQIVQASHDMLVGGNGLRLGAHVIHAWTRPSLGPAIPDVKARTLYANVEAGYPLILKQAFSLRAAAGLDLVNQNVDFGGLPLSEDRLRVAYGRLDAEAIDLRGVGPDGAVGWKFHASLELRKGLDVLGASPHCTPNPAICGAPGFVPPSLADGDPTALVVRGLAWLDLMPLRGMTVQIAPRFQYSRDRLFSFEQLSAGNYTIGRGFDPGAAVGDKGYGIQTELSADEFSLSARSRTTLRPYAFVDAAWLRDRGAGVQRSQRVVSAGAGVRLNLGLLGHLDLTAAIPLSTLSGEAGRRPARLLIAFTKTILPWRNR